MENVVQNVVRWCIFMVCTCNVLNQSQNALLQNDLWICRRTYAIQKYTYHQQTKTTTSDICGKVLWRMYSKRRFYDVCSYVAKPILYGIPTILPTSQINFWTCCKEQQEKTRHETTNEQSKHIISIHNYSIMIEPQPRAIIGPLKGEVKWDRRLFGRRRVRLPVLPQRVYPLIQTLKI